MRVAIQPVSQHGKNSETINKVCVLVKIYIIRAIQKRYCLKLGHANNPHFNVIYNFILNNEKMYAANVVYLHSVSRYCAINLSCALPSPSHFFSPSASSLLRSRCSFLFGCYLVLPALSFHIFSIFIWFSPEFFTCFLFAIRFLSRFIFLHDNSQARFCE